MICNMIFLAFSRVFLGDLMKSLKDELELKYSIIREYEPFFESSVKLWNLMMFGWESDERISFSFFIFFGFKKIHISI